MRNSRNQKKPSGIKNNSKASQNLPLKPRNASPGFLQALELIPNQIAFARLLLLFPLWYTAIFKYKASFAFFFLLAGATDCIDGYLARKLGQATHFGAAFDSFADNLVALSLVFWVYLLMPEVVVENTNIVVWLVLLLIVNLALQLLIYHRFVPLHLYSGKIATVLIYLFIAHSAVYGYSQTFFYVFAAVAAIAIVEELVIVLRRKTVDERLKTMFH